MNKKRITSYRLDEIPKASVHLWENMSDPAIAHSVEVNHTPFSRAFNLDGSIWTFFDRPEQKARHHRFDLAMKGVAALEPADNILKGVNPFFGSNLCTTDLHQVLSGHPCLLTLSLSMSAEGWAQLL